MGLRHSRIQLNIIGVIVSVMFPVDTAKVQQIKTEKNWTYDRALWYAKLDLILLSRVHQRNQKEILYL